MTTLNIVVPCYNEEAVLPETLRRLLVVLDQLQQQDKVSASSQIYCVDDGSSDNTWALIEQHAALDARVCGIKLSANRGHQNALLAGLLSVEGDAVISIDADLQDDIGIIEEMVDAFHDGSDVVYGVRRRRDQDTLFKRLSARCFYRILQLMRVQIQFDHADFRLMSRRALDALKEYSEVNLFLRGLIPTIGFPSKVIKYDRHSRFAGESKYPFYRMLALAVDGITSFSAVPLRMIAGLGILIFILSLLLSFWALWIRMFSVDAVPGWASSVLPTYLLGGLQLFSTGVVGEYVAKTYLETKRRPRFIIEKVLGQKDK
ncbi:MAG: glycosyltransferase family 2 protein [Motiliproteus sp.]